MNAKQCLHIMNEMGRPDGWIQPAVDFSVMYSALHTALHAAGADQQRLWELSNWFDNVLATTPPRAYRSDVELYLPTYEKFLCALYDLAQDMNWKVLLLNTLEAVENAVEDVKRNLG